jgi:hypothetical protein
VFFRYLSSPRSSAEQTNTRYREGGGGRDITLSIKEGLTHNIEFPVFARPTISGYLLHAATGPHIVGAGLGGGAKSNGLHEPPKLAAASPGNTTLTARANVGANTITVASITDFAVTEIIAIGWGPNLEFVKIHASTAPAGSTITLDATTVLKFPHTIGEPVVQVKGATRLTANAVVGAGTLTVSATELSPITGFGIGDWIVIGPDGDAASLVSEYGQTETIQIHAATPPAGTTITLATNTVDGHSSGSWVYVVRLTGDASPTSVIHAFEPVSSLSGATDYYSLSRAVGADIFELIQDCKLGTFELSAESVSPLRFQTNWMGRFGAVTTQLTEDYIGQDPVNDLPFTTANGKYHIKFGASSNISSKLRQFTFSATNILADDIYTDGISRDEILDLAREANFSAQFYFDTAAEYYETFYGAGAPSVGTTPTTIATQGSVLMNWQITTSKRLCLWIPQLTWEAFPVEIDPEPKPIIVEAVGVPLKASGLPLYAVGVQNSDLLIY